MNPKKLTPKDITHKKGKEKIIMLTGYDFLFSSLMDNQIDIILVGDSLGNVLLGYPDTLKVTMDQMLHHTGACARAAETSLVVGDMPFGSYQASCKDAIDNACRFIKEADADAVKIESSLAFVDTIKSVVKSGIPVMGHVGLLPQQILNLGEYKVQGKAYESAKEILDTSLALQDAGCFSVVLECIPYRLAKIITEKLSIPTIGIGSGSFCDGQVLVTHDMLGLTLKEKMPKFVRQYRNWKNDFLGAIKEFKKDVEEGNFPGTEESFAIDEEILKKLKS